MLFLLSRHNESQDRKSHLLIAKDKTHLDGPTGPPRGVLGSRGPLVLKAYILPGPSAGPLVTTLATPLLDGPVDQSDCVAVSPRKSPQVAFVTKLYFGLGLTSC